jgi:hypothetical protein
MAPNESDAMNKITIVTLLATAGLASAAQAQSGPGRGDPWGDATVSRAEEQTKAGERFAALDTNKDGAISAEEQEAAQGQRGPGGMGGGGLRRADSDGDGKITSAEYLAAQLQRFDSQDADKNGQLTKAERNAARAARMGRGNGGGWGGAPGRDGGGENGGNGGGWGGPPPGGE